MSSPILTCKGFKKLKDIKVGERIPNPDGSIQTITHLHPVYKARAVEYIFKNRDKLETCVEHLMYGGWRKDKSDYTKSFTNKNCVKPTKVIFKRYLEIKRGKKENRPIFSVPLPKALPMNKQKINLDPYLLGVLLGDGCLTQINNKFKSCNYIKISGSNEKIKHFEKMFNFKHSIYHIQGDAFDYRFLKSEKGNEVINELKNLKLAGLNGSEKFVPELYKNNDIETRLNVLRGMLDTDGVVEPPKNKKNTDKVKFYSVNKQLANDAKFLAQSLGYCATINLRKTREKKEKNGKVYLCKPCYEVYIKGENLDNLFLLKRKKELAKKIKNRLCNEKSVISMKLKEEWEDFRCITVSNPNGLFIANDFTVTHNSWCGCEWLLYMCICYPGIKLFIGRNELTRLRSSTYVTWNKVCKEHNIPSTLWKLNSQYNYIEFLNFKTKTFDGYGSRIDLLDVSYKPSDPLYERFGSIEYTSGWLEEVGEINEKAFDVLKSRIGRHQVEGYTIFSKMLLTCNPKKNWTYSQVYKLWKEKKQKDGITFFAKDSRGNDIVWAFIQSLHKDNPYNTKSYEKTLDAIKDKVLRERLKNGNWEYENDDANLFNYEAILDIFTNDFVNYETEVKEKKEEEKNKYTSDEEFDPNYETVDEYLERTASYIAEDKNVDNKIIDINSNRIRKETERYLTVDVAGYGRDKNVFTLWEGLMIIKVWTLNKEDLRPTNVLKKRLKIVQEKIKKIRTQYHVPASHVLIDDDGLGQGVVDDVYNYKGFVNNSSPVEEFNADQQETKKYNYRNLKAQCWYTLAEYVNNHKIGCYKEIPEEIKMKLIEDLEIMKRRDYEKDELALMVITKKEIKEAIGRSPDYGDTLMMRMYFELGNPGEDHEYGVAF